MNRFACSGFVAALSGLLLALAGGEGGAAPVPKGAGKNDPTPSLKGMLDVVEDAVKDKKWPKEDAEKLLRASAQVIFDRTAQAADQRARKLPVGYDKLKKVGPGKKVKETDLDDVFVIAGEVQSVGARNSVIFASGRVEITSATDCVIFAPTVRCVAVENCVVIAGEAIMVTSAWRPFGGDGSVLVAGRWIRAAKMDGTLCHVLKPTTLPVIEEGEDREAQHPAIRVGTAKGVIFLNDRNDAKANEAQNETYLAPKDPIAK